jgi:uncharacterized protein YlxW (UPF0749 family)
MRASKATLSLVLFALLLGAAGAYAADNSKEQKEQVKRLQQAQRKLEQEKTQLQQEKEGLESQVKETSGKLEGAKRASARASAHGATLEKDLKAAEEEKLQLKSKLEETVRLLAEQTEGRFKAESEGKRLSATLSAALSAQEKATAACETKNVQLYRYSQEMAARFEKKDALGALLQAEPLTGLKRVEIENLLEEYRDKLDSQKIEQTTGRAVSGQ